MKLTFDIEPDQAAAIYREECRKHTLADVELALSQCLTSKVTLTDEEFERAADYALEIQDNEINYVGIAARAVRRVLFERQKVQATDPLDDALKLLGLEKLEYFYIKTPEFEDQTFYFDEFGDVFQVQDVDAWEHDYLTLGRILKEYHDKIVPMQGGRT